MKRENVIVFFEGEDKTGKSTLIKLFNKKTNYSYMVLDRFLVSSLVYDKLYGRDNYLYYMNLLNKSLQAFTLIEVYCEADENTITKRLKENHEELDEYIENHNNTKREFDFIHIILDGKAKEDNAINEKGNRYNYYRIEVCTNDEVLEKNNITFEHIAGWLANNINRISERGI